MVSTRSPVWIAGIALWLACAPLAGCTLSRPDYVAPDVRVGEPAFARAVEAHTLSSPVDGNRHLHAKTMVVDGRWVSIGSVNIDNRSFALNSELNVTFQDRALAAEMTRVFRRDLALARPVTLEEWQRGAMARLFSMPLLPLRNQLGAGGGAPPTACRRRQRRGGGRGARAPR